MTAKTRKQRVVVEPYKTNTGPTMTIGEWTWKPELLAKKIVRTGEDDCYAWLGSVGVSANQFGASKAGKKQMTQASRLWYMQCTGNDARDLQIRHTCGNPFCMNERHFITEPNQQFFYKDGSPRVGTTRDHTKVKVVKTKPEPGDKWWIK